MSLCDLPCLLGYFSSLPEAELLRSFLFFLLVLPMFMTVCHEAGHYYACRLCGIDADEFALGKGPALLRLRVAILRFHANSTRCRLAVRLFPFGGSVTYDDRYWTLSHAQRAFMSAAGWLADIFVALLVVAAVACVGNVGPESTVVCMLVGLRVVTGLLPITGDGRSVIRHLWRAAFERR